jgi:hypothetical protein
LIYIMDLMRQFDAGGRIDWQQLAAWQEVTGVRLAPLEIDVIRAIAEEREKASQ